MNSLRQQRDRPSSVASTARPRRLALAIVSALAFSGTFPGAFPGAFSGLASGQAPLTLPAEPTTKSSTPPTVSELIERLGSPSYATRVRAKEMLQRVGLEAFDALHQAQYHVDSEIAMAARHLVSSLMVSWSKEGDPPAVRDALKEYGAQSESERSGRMELLADLPKRQGLEALVRLTRFETSLRLSRHAALLLMQQPMSEDAATRRNESEVVLDVLGDNDRQAAQWLRVYAEDLAQGTYSAEKWRDLIAQQRYEIDAAATQQASRATVTELVRVSAARAVALDQPAEALELAIAHIDLIPPTTRDLIDASSWAIDHDLHPFVLELRRQHPRLFDQQPVLLYGAAEAMTAAGDPEQAEVLAKQALAIDPLPQTEQQREQLSPKAIEEIAHAHREIGRELQLRGLFRWAEREFMQIIESLDVTSVPAAHARVHLASMLGDMQRHEDVVSVLAPLLERVDNDDAFAGRLRSLHVAYPVLRSNLEFHRGLAASKSGDLESAMPLLQRAFELDEQNVDILIAMYRLDGGPAWDATVMDLLQRQIRISQLRIQQDDARSRQLGRPQPTESDLANSLNAYAWLVSNTEGDYQRALDYSLRSLAIEPDQPAMLDTLARCYFAVGDLVNAVHTQKRAVRLMPHSPPMLRQLAEFEAALAAADD